MVYSAEQTQILDLATTDSDLLTYLSKVPQGKTTQLQTQAKTTSEILQPTVTTLEGSVATPTQVVIDPTTGQPYVPTYNNKEWNPWLAGQTGSGVVSVDQLNDQYLYKKAAEIENASKSIINQQAAEAEVSQKQIASAKEYYKFLNDPVPEGATRLPISLWKPSNGIYPKQWFTDTYLQKIQANQQNTSEKIEESLNQTVDKWKKQQQANAQYNANKKAFYDSQNDVAPTPTSGESASPFDNLAPPPETAPPSNGGQSILDPPPVEPGLSPQQILKESGYNTTPDLVSQPSSSYQPLSSLPKQGLQTQPPGESQLTAPPAKTGVTLPDILQEPVSLPSLPSIPKPDVTSSQFKGTAGAGIVYAGYAIATGTPPLKAIFTTGAALVAGGIVGTGVTALSKSAVLGQIVGAAVGIAAGNLAGDAYDAVSGAFSSSGTPQTSPSLPKAGLADAANLKAAGGQCEGVLYTVKLHGYFSQDVDGYGNPPSEGKQAGLWQMDFQATDVPGPITGVGDLGGWAYGFSPSVRIYYGSQNTWAIATAGAYRKISGDFGEDPAHPMKPINVFLVSATRQDGEPDNCGTLPASSNLQFDPNYIPPVIDYSPYNQSVQQQPPGLAEQDPQPQTPPAAPPDPSQNKGKPKTAYIPAGKSGTVTTPSGQQQNIPASSSPQSVTANPNGSITVDPNNGNAPYTLSSPGNGPVSVNIPGYQPITVNPDGTTTGGTTNPFNPTTLIPTPLKPTSLTPKPLTPSSTDPAQTPTQTPTSNPDLQKFLTDPNTTLVPAILAGLTPILKQILDKSKTTADQTTPDALKKASVDGTCSTLQPGGCMLPLANNAKSGADNSAAAATNSGIALTDLALTQKGIGDLKKAVGTSEFPATVPATLVTAGLGSAAAVRSIPNLAQFQAWTVEQIDALMGAFHIPIQIPGGKNLSIPNVAEGMAEQIGMELVNVQNTEMLLNLCTKTIAEVGQIKQQAYKTYMAVEAIIDYLNFKHTEVVQNMPLSFVPGEGDLMTLLQDKLHPVSVIKYDDKINQRTILLDLAQAAAITRAANFVHVKGTTPADVRDELIGQVKGHKANADKLFEDKKDAQGHDSTDRFYNQIQKGYADGQNPFTCEGEEPPTITRKKNPVDPPYTK